MAMVVVETVAMRQHGEKEEKKMEVRVRRGCSCDGGYVEWWMP